MDIQQVAQEAVGSLGSQIAQLQLMLRVTEMELAAERESNAEVRIELASAVEQYTELKSAFDSLTTDDDTQDGRVEFDDDDAKHPGD